jgi:hypothetical protein
MPRKLIRIFSLLTILGCGHLCYAQQPLAPVRLFKQADGRFTGNAVVPQLSDKIVTSRAMIIPPGAVSSCACPSFTSRR